MGEGGLEPPRPCEHWHLKPARLPFRHSPELARRRYPDGIPTPTPTGLRISSAGRAYTQGVTSEEELLALRDEMVGYRAEIEEARQHLRSAESVLNVAKTEAERQGEIAREALARLNQLERELKDLAVVRHHLDLTKREVADIYASRTWKVGRVVMSPVRLIRRIFTR